jgi:hypothetical protein
LIAFWGASISADSSAKRSQIMLTIQKEQMAVLGDHMREDYIKKTLRNLAELFPDNPTVNDEPATRSLIEYGIETAEVYAITARREVSLFIFLIQDLGRDFEKRPENKWIEELLLDPELEEQEKMDLIYTRLELAGKTL